MTAETLCSAIVGHLVGDYLLQNDWMALNKKKSGVLGADACILHCILWTLAVLVFSGWWVWWVPVALFITHYAQDRTNVVAWWMTRVNSQEKFAAPPCGPWSVIVVDNVWHIVTIWLVWRFVA